MRSIICFSQISKMRQQKIKSLDLGLLQLTLYDGQ